MSNGLCRSHFILGKALGSGVASQREGKTLLGQGTSPCRQILQSAPKAPGRTLVPARLPGAWGRKAFSAAGAPWSSLRQRAVALT